MTQRLSYFMSFHFSIICLFPLIYFIYRSFVSFIVVYFAFQSFIWFHVCLFVSFSFHFSFIHFVTHPLISFLIIWLVVNYFASRPFIPPSLPFSWNLLLVHLLYLRSFCSSSIKFESLSIIKFPVSRWGIVLLTICHPSTDMWTWSQLVGLSPHRAVHKKLRWNLTTSPAPPIWKIQFNFS